MTHFCIQWPRGSEPGLRGHVCVCVCVVYGAGWQQLAVTLWTSSLINDHRPPSGKSAGHAHLSVCVCAHAEAGWRAQEPARSHPFKHGSRLSGCWGQKNHRTRGRESIKAIIVAFRDSPRPAAPAVLTPGDPSELLQRRLLRFTPPTQGWFISSLPALTKCLFHWSQTLSSELVSKFFETIIIIRKQIRPCSEYVRDVVLLCVCSGYFFGILWGKTVCISELCEHFLLLLIWCDACT